MPFVNEILKRKSVSIVGLAKNAGKTEVLNYVLRRLGEGGVSGGEGAAEARGERVAGETGAASRVAVTSIGLDGESVDQVKLTPKPEIELPEGTVFTTSETHYRAKKLVAEVLDVSGGGGGCGKTGMAGRSQRWDASFCSPPQPGASACVAKATKSTEQRSSIRDTALGRLVTARALTAGKIILSGPSDTDSVRALIGGMGRFGVSTVLVDGALSRLSHGSPAVTEAMVLVTGAAVSHSISTLVRQTKYVFDRTRLPEVENGLAVRLEGLREGVWAVGEASNEGGGEGVGEAVSGVAGRDFELHDLGSKTMLGGLGGGKAGAAGRSQRWDASFCSPPPVVAAGCVAKATKNTEPSGDVGDIFRFGTTIFVPGVVSERLLEQLRVQSNVAEIRLIVRDFTRIFATPETYYSFLARGGRIHVLQRSEVLAVCVNPCSPDGYRLDGDTLIARMSEALGVPVYDVRRI